MQVGTTKDQGLYNKPSAAVHPGALAAGTLTYIHTYIHAYIPLCSKRLTAVTIQLTLELSPQYGGRENSDLLFTVLL